MSESIRAGIYQISQWHRIPTQTQKALATGARIAIKDAGGEVEVLPRVEDPIERIGYDVFKPQSYN